MIASDGGVNGKGFNFSQGAGNWETEHSPASVWAARIAILFFGFCRCCCFLLLILCVCVGGGWGRGHKGGEIDMGGLGSESDQGH